jgi:hypothetical protein
MMDDEANLAHVRDAPKVILRRHAVGRRGFDDRAGEIQQRRRDRNLEGVGQIHFVVRRLIDQNQMMSASAAGALRVIDRPEVYMAAIGQADLAEHPVDAYALYASQGVGDGVQQRRHQGPRRREKSAAPPQQCSVDGERDQETRLAPSAIAHQDDASMIANEIERFDLRGMQRRLGQDDRSARGVAESFDYPTIIFRKAGDSRAGRLRCIAGRGRLPTARL